MSVSPLRVHVCVDQESSDAESSGLVRSWMHFLEEATRHPDLDVTAHFVGAEEASRPLGPNVRIREHALAPGVTALVERLGLRLPVRVGLFPFHPGLARELRRAQLIHTAYTCLSQAMTASWVARHHRIPLVNSLHTNVPLQAEIYARKFARLLFARTPLQGPLVVRDRFARSLRRAFDAQVRWYLGRCRHVFASMPESRPSVPEGFPEERRHYLGRGIDHDLFHPTRRDRAWLRERFGIAEDDPVVLFVGKLAVEKDVLTLAHALDRLRDGGVRFRLLLCGVGDQRDELQSLLGDRALFVGLVPHPELARIYASSDLFAFPSPTEVYANVVVEAMSSGLPVLVSDREGARQHVGDGEEWGRVVESGDPEAWALAISRLLRDPLRRQVMGSAGRAQVEKHYSSWAEIFDGTLLPVWLAAAGRRL